MQRPQRWHEQPRPRYQAAPRPVSVPGKGSRGPAPRESARTDQQEGVRRGAFDYSVALSAIVLVVIGLLFVLSSSSYTEGIKGDSLSAFRQQAIWACVGLAGMVGATIFDYRKLRNARLVWLLMGVTLVMLFMVKLLPRASGPLRAPYINGSQRWIRIMAGETTLLSIQPSEIAKFTLIVFLCVKLANRPRIIKSFSKTMAPCLLVAAGFAALILWQPNMSTAMTLLIVSMLLLFISGVPIRQLFLPVVAMLPLAALLIYLEPYRLDRFLSFQDPWSMAGDEGYQLVQSFYALGNGGLFGTGFGMSRQKYQFLPYASSDFIFAIVAEELGFVGAFGVMALFFLLIYFGLRVAMKCPDRFGMLLATGIVALIAVQVVINIAVVTGSMPTTGLPLPFFTAGGTSLAIFMTEVGVLLSVSRLKRVTDVAR